MPVSVGECVICLSSLPSSDAYTTQCGHIFHEGCIKTWLNTTKNCPTCRLTAREYHLIKLFVQDPISNSDIYGIQIEPNNENDISTEGESNFEDDEFEIITAEELYFIKTYDIVTVEEVNEVMREHRMRLRNEFLTKLAWIIARLACRYAIRKVCDKMSR
uniref:RING-type domain-containing protein n=1 Tax=Panagrolaimus sp. ES5 TaxID=591445 RepID=A0AC34F891_9BILA